MVVLTSFTQPTDGIRHRQQNTAVYVNDNNLGNGTLYIAESRLSWINETGSGFSIEYPHIALHAISRDLSAFPQECLFLMLDTSLADEDQNSQEEEDDEGDDLNKQETTEMRLVPDDRGMLDAMFHAMNACQALHPDPEDSFSDEDFFEDADDETPMEEADSQMARLRIGSMDGRAHIEDRVGGMVGGMRVGTALGNVGGREGGTGEGTRESTALGNVGDMEEDMGEGRVGISEDMGEGRVGISEDMGEGRVGISEDMGEGRVGILGGMEGGRIRILGDTEAGRIRILGGMEEDMEAGMEAGMEAYTEIRMARGDRSFFLGNTSHPNRTAGFPPAQTPHMVLDSNFDDAEN